MDDVRFAARIARSRDALMLLLDAAQLKERRDAARGPLAPLYESLTAELEPLLRSPLYVPATKALLSRVGGRCETDGSTLEFDPFSPSSHRCARCGRAHTGELHDRAWVTSYQLWLAERAVHAALFFVLGGDERHRALARKILLGYADRYASYPNRDNVLGPTRLFFSTYLESIWLLQICIAADLLATAGDRAIASLVCERIVGPSSAIIAEFDEGMSNRQVWNNAALLAAAALRGDDGSFERIVAAPSGLHAHLQHALLADGTWYEGDNYHLFALRGLWYGVTIAEARGHSLPSAQRERFQSAFSAPFLTALPDFTMPARKDSQYAISLRQWRVADLAELGIARAKDATLTGALARLYEPGHDRGDTGRARSTADVERNAPASALSRADLGWRALLHALPELPPLVRTQPRSVLLEAQGYAVFRREDGVYVGFEFGQAGGGHGHPDRLNLVLAERTTRWLDDLGTGSYVDPSLHWYRSTLAHNAPLVNGRSQPLHAGELVAYDEREAVGWIVGRFVVDDVELERVIAVAPDYLIDELRWIAPRDVRVELPVHLEGLSLRGGHAALSDATRASEGYSFLSDVRTHRVQNDGDRWMLGVTRGQPAPLFAHFSGKPIAEFLSATGPGQPSAVTRRFCLVRVEGKEGLVRSIFSWRGEIAAVGIDGGVDGDTVTLTLGDEERHRHRRDERGWHVELFAGDARSSVDLSGFRARVARPKIATPSARRVRTVLGRSERLTFQLGEQHYRRSEQSWRDAGSPEATIELAADAASLAIVVGVRAGDPVFAPAEASNPFDNESADTMRAGVQLYVRSAGDSGGWMLVPDADGDTVRVRPIDGWGNAARPRGRWRRSGRGYEMLIDLPIDTNEIDIDVIINETTSDRERRRGQLVLSGASGEFVYLRGDRHDAARLIPLTIAP
jgi:hypothetical protein